jgi:hypothetical protein
MPDKPLESRITKDWSNNTRFFSIIYNKRYVFFILVTIGFQGDDPSTDFRGIFLKKNFYNYIKINLNFRSR